LRNSKKEKSVNHSGSLTVTSRTENLSRIRSFISGLAKQIGFPPAAIDNIILAVDEACTNIIKHAYRSVPDGKIIIRLKYLNRKLIISITDYGNSFEPALIPEPDLKKYYEQHRVGGLGMYLMKTLMDDVKYTSVPGKYNQVLLSKRINSA
jgi:serine/threonine-protein kinase RsbW